MKTLKIGSTQFAHSKSALVGSLFNSGGTCNGTFHVRKGGILFKNAKGENFAFLVANRHGERFLVSCSDHNGKTVYHYALSDADAVTLGVSSLKYSEQHSEAERAWSDAQAFTVAPASRYCVRLTGPNGATSYLSHRGKADFAISTAKKYLSQWLACNPGGTAVVEPSQPTLHTPHSTLHTPHSTL